MPRKITGITIDNYRAWFGPYPKIELPNGENLLVYGENGSGKSSFFKGIQNFFRSSQGGSPAFELNVFSVEINNTQGRISIDFLDTSANPHTTSQYIYSLPGNSTNDQQFIINTKKLNSFLDYKYLLGVHFADPEAQKVPDVFEFLIEGLLGEFINPGTGNGLKNDIDSIKSGLSRNVGSSYYDGALNNIPIVRGAIAQIINDVLQEANRLVTTYFDPTLTIEVADFSFELDPHHHKRLVKKFQIQARYSGRVISNFNYFLNEARLSAIGICFFLGAVLSHPPAATEFKILFLDDVFIGLDTSNRLPLINILRQEFADYQIFMTTYDRNWFELAKDQLNANQWKLIELFHESIIVPNPAGGTVQVPEKPVMIESSFTFLEKAKQYFKTKDYPACSNYLRKELERVLRKLLPLERRVNIDEHFGSKDETKLENLLNSFNNYVKDCNVTLPQQTMDAVKLYRTLVLNPQSHNDIQSPVYRAELEKAFSAIQQLSLIPEISRTIVATLGSQFVYQNQGNHNYSMQLELTDNIYKVTCGANNSVSNYKFRIVGWTWNGVQNATNLQGAQMVDPQLSEFCATKRSLNEVFQVITYGGHNQMPGNLEQAISLAGQTLHQLLI